VLVTPADLSLLLGRVMERVLAALRPAPRTSRASGVDVAALVRALAASGLQVQVLQVLTHVLPALALAPGSLPPLLAVALSLVVEAGWGSEAGCALQQRTIAWLGDGTASPADADTMLHSVVAAVRRGDAAALACLPSLLQHWPMKAIVTALRTVVVALGWGQLAKHPVNAVVIQWTEQGWLTDKDFQALLLAAGGEAEVGAM
jgi:hypothetical protein